MDFAERVLISKIYLYFEFHMMIKCEFYRFQFEFLSPYKSIS